MRSLAKKYVDEFLKVMHLESELKEAQRKLANAKELEKHLSKEMKNDVLNSGGRVDDDHTSGMNWWVFKGGLTEEEIFERLEEIGVYEDTDRGVFDDNDWDCSGKTMTNRPYIAKRTPTRVLVTQCWSIDC